MDNLLCRFGFIIRNARISAFAMRKEHYNRIENPYIHIVWIVAVGNELKVANPDNITPYFDAILSKIKQ